MAGDRIFKMRALRALRNWLCSTGTTRSRLTMRDALRKPLQMIRSYGFCLAMRRGSMENSSNQ